ncbi:MAG: MBOAT family protein [Faecalibacterium sp.]|nr:MBOAT family protein [Faecalibacterium sp.]
MFFTSLSFLLYLVAGVLVYWLLPHKVRWWFLLAFSIVYYYSIGKKLIVFVALAAGVTWAAGLALEKLLAGEKAALAKAKADGADRAARSAVKAKWLVRRRLVIAGFVAIVLGMLLFFKFYNMFAQLMQAYFTLPLWKRAMPLGISFYTLMLVSYVMDVHTGRIKAEHNPFKVALFTIWFPQVIQGPIGRWGQLAPELFGEKKFDYDRFVLGWQRMLWGYFRKLVVADRFSILVNTVFDNHTEYSGFVVLFATFFYVVQLYCDFAGGIDIALGAAELFGVKMAENFNLPFASQSVSEFWRRWHITLGSFLRDHIFYPLTLSKPFAKLGKALQKPFGRNIAKMLPGYLAMFILWFCSGVWHGEGWHYVAYGMYHGTLIVMGMCAEQVSPKVYAKLGIAADSKSLALFRTLRTCVLVGIGEIIFRAETTAAAMQMLRSAVTVWNPWVLFDGTLLTLGLDGADLTVGLLATIVVFAASSLSKRCESPLREVIYRQELPIRWFILLLGIAVVCIFGVYGPAYDATPFVYYQF